VSAARTRYERLADLVAAHEPWRRHVVAGGPLHGEAWRQLDDAHLDAFGAAVSCGCSQYAIAIAMDAVGSDA